jgi:hypothetical protein
MANYSNAVIYKIYCKDAAITECYVGSTCNFMSRKSKHKYSCNNKNTKDYTYPVYNFIRENGGWENFEMVELIKYPCNTKRELEIKETEYLELHGGTLNKCIPSRSKLEYYHANREREIERSRAYHEKNRERENKKKREKINCECGSIICKSGKWRHIKTPKHKQYLELN